MTERLTWGAAMSRAAECTKAENVAAWVAYAREMREAGTARPRGLELDAVIIANPDPTQERVMFLDASGGIRWFTRDRMHVAEAEGFRQVFTVRP